MKVVKPSNNPLQRGYSSTHKGYDFKGLNLPDEVRAGMDGEIISRVDLYTTNWINTGTLTTKDYGNYIKIKHLDGTFELHAHLRKGSSFLVGTKVKAGQTVARIGNTGNSTGPHLHSEYRNSANTSLPAEFIELAVPQPPMNESQQDKQVQFDRILIYLREQNAIDTDASEQWTKPIAPDKLLNFIKEKWEERLVDRPKASKADWLAQQVGLSGQDSSKEEIFDAIKELGSGIDSFRQKVLLEADKFVQNIKNL